ncbi:hypothetical protein SAMN02745163_04110 [Clostridium cavendishii DSM 21758]|uniref:Uncharacterized protein n=1 Tax=Clostridium cavendishii DSM 21758 TaxID=1121302 RepID=A0A1M6TTK0_9CLOT|nr:DUF6514 family protein [Clostridium cavendishii]SHK60261.1 hypothetical protein SAMN02745163_04110 [Clostridium cavendishii DSM 21758]
MMIVEDLCRNNTIGDVDYKYSYRITKNNYKDIQVYGIEVERLDYRGNLLVNIERDSVRLISPQIKKVQDLLKLLYDNLISPIHLVDIIGVYVDEYVKDFEINNLEAIIN